MEDLGELYQLYAQTVYRFLYSKCRDGPMAEELTQETFYRAVYSIKRWDGSCQITTWLCRIAYHVWQQTLEKENRRMRNRGVQPRVDKSPSAEEEVLAADGEMALWKALHRLREPAREVLYLRLFGDFRSDRSEKSWRRARPGRG